MKKVKLDVNEAVAIMVVAIGVILLLGYLGTGVGSQWTTVQGLVAPFVVLIVVCVVCIAYVVRR